MNAGPAGSAGSAEAERLTAHHGAAGQWQFDDPWLPDALDRLPLDRVDELGFGLIVMNRSGTVVGYNSYESKRAGIGPERVLHRNFFIDVGPCCNNYLVAQRYADCPDLDEQLDYVFTFRMAPTPVRLRMMARAASPRQYLAVRPR